MYISFLTDFQSKEIDLSHDKVYQDTTTTCKYENVKYNVALAALSNFTVTKEFATAVCQLPFNLTGSEANYYSLFDTWGTVGLVRCVLYRKYM